MKLRVTRHIMQGPMTIYNDLMYPGVDFPKADELNLFVELVAEGNELDSIKGLAISYSRTDSTWRVTSSNPASKKVAVFN